MSTPLGIFDREYLVKTIDRDCLGDSGTSAVVVGAHKVGKTHLLKHIASRPLKSQESLFCNIDLYLLNASLDDGETLSDHVFLKFFLSKLIVQIDDSIQSQNEEKELWNSDIIKAEQELALLENVSSPTLEKMRAELKEQHRISITAVKQKLRQLETLEGISKDIHALLESKEAIAVFKVVYIFNRLQTLNKRVILIIDEYDRMLREKGFTDRLFGFLRGANNEGKIIALVTSHVHLMDESLHANSGASDRMSLFNHFRLQTLDPFNGNEALGFLDWAQETNPALTAEEKVYIQKLGGGSPYFLQQIREEFLKRLRPSSPQERETFEKKYLAPMLEEGFHEIWKRLGSAEMTGLKQVAGGEEAELLVKYKLEREGYVISSEEKTSLFSPLFTEFVKRQPRSQDISAIKTKHRLRRRSQNFPYYRLK